MSPVDQVPLTVPRDPRLEHDAYGPGGVLPVPAT
jgi:hypothetical protein